MRGTPKTNVGCGEETAAPSRGHKRQRPQSSKTVKGPIRDVAEDTRILPKTDRDPKGCGGSVSKVEGDGRWGQGSRGASHVGMTWSLGLPVDRSHMGERAQGDASNGLNTVSACEASGLGAGNGVLFRDMQSFGVPCSCLTVAGWKPRAWDSGSTSARLRLAARENWDLAGGTCIITMAVLTFPPFSLLS